MSLKFCHLYVCSCFQEQLQECSYFNELLFCSVSGPIPDGADAVVQVEDTERVETASSEPNRVRILVKINKGVDIRPVVITFNMLQSWQNIKKRKKEMLMRTFLNRDVT